MKKRLFLRHEKRQKKGSGSMQKPSARTPETTSQQKVSPESDNKPSPEPEESEEEKRRKTQKLAPKLL